MSLLAVQGSSCTKVEREIDLLSLCCVVLGFDDIFQPQPNRTAQTIAAETKRKHVNRSD